MNKEAGVVYDYLMTQDQDARTGAIDIALANNDVSKANSLTRGLNSEQTPAIQQMTWSTSPFRDSHFEFTVAPVSLSAGSASGDAWRRLAVMRLPTPPRI